MRLNLRPSCPLYRKIILRSNHQAKTLLAAVLCQESPPQQAKSFLAATLHQIQRSHSLRQCFTCNRRKHSLRQCFAKKRKKTIMYQSLRFTRRLLPRPVFKRNYYIRTVIQLSFAKYNLSCTLYLRSKRRRFFYDKKGTFVLPHPLHLLTTSELSLVEINYQFVYFTLLQ